VFCLHRAGLQLMSPKDCVLHATENINTNDSTKNIDAHTDRAAHRDSCTA